MNIKWQDNQLSSYRQEKLNYVDNNDNERGADRAAERPKGFKRLPSIESARAFSRAISFRNLNFLFAHQMVPVPIERLLSR